MSFFSELKRRNVFRVGAAYLVVAWLLVQVVDTLGDLFAMPEAFGRGVVILLVIGFPVALIVSWVFELTPSGIKTQDEADQSGTHTSSTKLNAVIICGLALALAFVVLDAYVLEDSVAPVTEEVALEEAPAIFQGEITQTTSDEKSIAILPFTNLSSDPDQEYFSDGLTEELINTLSGINGLLVTGRTSAFFFKDSEENPRQIAESLGVNHILQGSVRKSGDQLRISTTLMNTSTGFNLWTETFDRQLADIFDIQDEIARAVSQALSVTLGVGEFNRPGLPRNVEAYDMMIRGQAFRMQGSYETNMSALQLFLSAAELEPDSGLLWVRLANVYRGLSLYVPQDEQEALLNNSDEALARARSLAPDMPELANIDLIALFNQQNYIDVEQRLLQRVSRVGSSAVDHGWFAAFLLRVGRAEEALVQANLAKRLDPLSIDESNREYLFIVGRDEEALEDTDRFVELGGSPLITANFKMTVALSNGNWDQAATFAKGTVTSRALNDQFIPYLESGDTETAIIALRQVLATQDFNPVQFRGAAMYAALFGEPALALELIVQSNAAERDIWRNYYSDMRRLPAFKELMVERGLVDYWRTTGNWADFCRPLEGGDDFECF